jgi:glyoxylase I family protein
VTDLDRSIRFYSDVLGAVVVRGPYVGDNPSFSGRMALVMLGRNGLDLFEHTVNDGKRFEAPRTGLDHLALAAESLEHLQMWAAWLDDQGVRCSEIRVTGVGAMFDFADPDGIQFEFFFTDQERLRQSELYSSVTSSS